MTVNEIMSALALRLGELFPERAVYYTQIPREADGNHYIRCTDQSHTKKLGRRRTASRCSTSAGRGTHWCLATGRRLSIRSWRP